jgi:2,4-dienoyl-CoA reductase-like NADH-dependent reductase (Old Yellow Enzyme family)
LKERILTAPSAAKPIQIGGLTLQNRIVGTAHASGAVWDGLPLPGDADYWRRRAAGGAAMLTVGGTLVSPHSAPRSATITEAWKPEVVAGLTARAAAIRDEGAVAACQLAHLGRETLGAEIWRHPVAPSAIKSPREFVRPRAVTDEELDGIVEDFRISAHHAVVAGFQVIELHAAHGYLLAQFLSAASNTRDVPDPMLDGVQLLGRIREAITATAPDVAVGVRVSAEGEEEAGLSYAGLTRLLPYLADFDYLNLTVGVRTTYVRDMATETPPLLEHVEELAAASPVPLLVSHAFRRGSEIEQALQAGAALVGVARPLIADPDFPSKILQGREAEVRPCTSCNEDCRAKEPVLLCSVNPDLGPPGRLTRPAEPLVIRQVHEGLPRRVAVVGAGPAGLETALRLRESVQVEVFEERTQTGGQLLTAARAPHRSGWLRLLDYYRHMLDGVPLHLGQRVGPQDLADFDEVVVAIGVREEPSDLQARATTSTDALRAGIDGLSGVRSVLVADDGSNGWPTVSAVELAVSAGCRVMVSTPASGFGAGIPAEPRAQLLRRLRGADVEVLPLTVVSQVRPQVATVRNVLSGVERMIEVDQTIVVGERLARPWAEFRECSARVQVIGDALVPRKVAHALAEGRAAAEAVVERLTLTPRQTKGSPHVGLVP